MKKLVTTFLLSLGLAALGGSDALAQNEVTIGYQLIYNPWKVAIVNGAFEKATGYKINWRKFDSGAKVINAMASGDVQIALSGSSPIAAAISRGVDVELVWIFEGIASAEALVVRDGSGIIAPQDLKGKKLGVPFASPYSVFVRQKLFHGYTYSGCPVASAAGLATLDIYDKEDLFARAARMSPSFLDMVFALQELSIVTDIRGYGLLAAFDLAPDKSPGMRGYEVLQRLFEAGMIAKITGDAVLLSPPLIIEETHLDEMDGKLRKVLNSF